MKRILLTLVCLLAFSVSAFATEERVNLPQDQGAWYLTIFGDDGQLQTWLKTDVGLAKLKSQVRFNEYTTNQLRYQRYAKDMPGLPCIRLQNEKGLVVSEFWGDNIPTTSAALYRGIKGDLQDKTSWGCLRRRRCPAPKREPEPTKPPVIVPVDTPVGPPVLDEEPEEPKESRMWILLVALGALAGGVFGFYQGYKAEHMDKASPPSKL
jgi:hypothetical protein